MEDETMNLAQPMPLALRWFGGRVPSLARQILLIVAGSAICALLAQVSIPLPFTPVPVTGQTLAVLLVGGALGSRLGSISMLLYLAEGAVGLPVFAHAQHGLPIGPTGGYLVGFIVMAAVVGWLHERGVGKNLGTSLGSMIIAEFVLYAVALPWLAIYVGWSHVLVDGFLPFVFGDAIKLFLAGLALPAAWRLTDGHASTER
jgi:biotin transport system substrate-specific component